MVSHWIHWEFAFVLEMDVRDVKLNFNAEVRTKPALICTVLVSSCSSILCSIYSHFAGQSRWPHFHRDLMNVWTNRGEGPIETRSSYLWKCVSATGMLFHQKKISPMMNPVDKFGPYILQVYDGWWHRWHCMNAFLEAFFNWFGEICHDPFH